MADHDVLLGNDLLGDDALRLLDVLLEEEAATTTAIVPATTPLPAVARVRQQNWQWLAAALLGIAVVVATSWLTTHAPTRTPTTLIQDPAPNAAEVVPFDTALLPRVVVVRMALANPHGMIGVDPNHSTEVRDATDLAAWREALNARADEQLDRVEQFTIDLGLGDGKVMRGHGWCGSLTFGAAAIPTTPAFQEVFQKAVGDLLRSGRIARGIAADLDELRQLDPTRRAIISPWLTADEARTELRRFPQLESIEFAPGACASSDVGAVRFRSGKGVALGLADIPTLQSITLIGCHLQADGLRALATLPKLRSLVIPSGLAEVPAEELGLLARRLEVLHAPGSLLSDEQLLAIRRSTTLKELWVRCGLTSQSLADCLVALPSLRRLSVAGWQPDCTPLLAAIARTRVAELQLDGMRLGDDAFAALAGLPSLHTLHLANVFPMSNETPDCAPLRQLRHLTLDWAVPQWLNRVRAALPNCTVHELGDPEDAWVSPFLQPRR